MDENETTDPLDRLWGDLLSRQPSLVREAYAGLGPEEQAAVLSHLQKMARESGWHPEQRLSASAALQALETGDEHGRLQTQDDRDR